MIEDKQKFQKDTKKMQKLKVSKENSCFFIEIPLKKEDLAALTNEYQKSLSFRKFVKKLKKFLSVFFSELSEEHKKLFNKTKESDKEIHKLKKENLELRQNLQKIIEKEENDKKYQLEIERVWTIFILFFCIIY